MIYLCYGYKVKQRKSHFQLCHTKIIKKKQLLKPTVTFANVNNYFNTQHIINQAHFYTPPKYATFFGI